MKYTLEYHKNNYQKYYDIFVLFDDYEHLQALYDAKMNEDDYYYSLDGYNFCYKQYRKYAIKLGVIKPKREKTKININ